MRTVILCACSTLLATPSVRADIIDFDNIPSWTQVSNQYPAALFSSEPGYITQTFPYNGMDNTSSPNVLGAAPIGGGSANTRNVYVDFTSPVNGLTFLAAAANEYGVIARVNVYSGNTLLGVQDIIGLAALPNTFGFGSVLVNLSAYAAITRIEIVPPLNQTDIDSSYGGGGLIYDDFSFEAVPSPSAGVSMALAGAVAFRRRRPPAPSAHTDLAAAMKWPAP
ncbi:MAG: hypothetical protein ACREJO_04635 [Phycisphaerales bacterium]